MSLRLKPSSAIMAPPFLRFQTEELDMWMMRKRENRRETGFDSVNGQPAQIKWNKNQNNLYAFMSNSLGFVN